MLGVRNDFNFCVFFSDVSDSPSLKKTESAFVANLLRRACLEAVAEIFDDLMVTMHEEDSDEVHIRILHAQLASTMWEVLVCCAVRSSEFRESYKAMKLLSRSKKDFLQDHEMMGASALLGSSVGGPQDFICTILIRLFRTCQMHVNAKCLQSVRNCDLVSRSKSIFFTCAPGACHCTIC